MRRHQWKATWIMNNQANMTLPKGINNVLVTDLKEMEIYKLPDKEFKITILTKLSELQENIGRQLNETDNRNQQNNSNE